MFFKPQNSSKNSLQLKIIPNMLSIHAAKFRFIFWQKQFKLISDDSSTWFKTWLTFYETYTTFINLNQINDFIHKPSININDNRLFHHIHIDVIRLSRYFNIFSDELEKQQNHIKRL
jgi:membrane carboxypeptidase/penicillin-binding protein PbpC